MTLRHIVLWKMNGETEEERDAQATEVVNALTPLRDLVPSVRALAVRRNQLAKEANYDVMLVGDFDDEDGLAAYVDHPAHVNVFELVRGYTASRAAIDFWL